MLVIKEIMKENLVKEVKGKSSMILLPVVVYKYLVEFLVVVNQ